MMFYFSDLKPNFILFFFFSSRNIFFFPYRTVHGISVFKKIQLELVLCWSKEKGLMPVHVLDFSFVNTLPCPSSHNSPGSVGNKV